MASGRHNRMRFCLLSLTMAVSLYSGVFCNISFAGPLSPQTELLLSLDLELNSKLYRGTDLRYFDEITGTAFWNTKSEAILFDKLNLFEKEQMLCGNMFGKRGQFPKAVPLQAYSIPSLNFTTNRQFAEGCMQQRKMLGLIDNPIVIETTVYDILDQGGRISEDYASVVNEAWVGKGALIVTPELDAAGQIIRPHGGLKRCRLSLGKLMTFAGLYSAIRNSASAAEMTVNIAAVLDPTNLISTGQMVKEDYDYSHSPELALEREQYLNALLEIDSSAIVNAWANVNTDNKTSPFSETSCQPGWLANPVIRDLTRLPGMEETFENQIQIILSPFQSIGPQFQFKEN